MTIGFLFWLLMILWFLFGLYWHWPVSGGPRTLYPLGGNVLLFILLFLLGWRVFGFPVQG